MPDLKGQRGKPFRYNPPDTPPSLGFSADFWQEATLLHMTHRAREGRMA